MRTMIILREKKFGLMDAAVEGGGVGWKKTLDEKKKKMEGKDYTMGQMAGGALATGAATTYMAKSLMKPGATWARAGKIGGTIGAGLALGSMLLHNHNNKKD